MMSLIKRSPASRSSAGPGRKCIQHLPYRSNLIAVKWIFKPSTARPSPLCLAVLAIVPGGKILGREYTALNPTRADRRPGRSKSIFEPAVGRTSPRATSAAIR
jgi:hypothetical protein